MPLSSALLKDMEPGKFCSDHAPRGAGQLCARRLKCGAIRFYYRYVDRNGKRHSLPIGAHDRYGLKGLSLVRARELVAELRHLQLTDGRDIRMILDERDRMAKAEAKALARAQEQKVNSTLGALMLAYVQLLKRRDQPSWSDVSNIVKNHLEQAWPELWNKPAVDVSQSDVMLVIGRPFEDDKSRTANKLRSFLHAAFNAAISAAMSVEVGSELRNMRITSNPVRDVPPIRGGNSSRGNKEVLSAEELKSYWRRIESLPGPHGAMLRFHLLTGCQRPTQLARVTMSDFREDDGAVVVSDPKGNRIDPREHIVPLTALAQQALAEMRGGEMGEFLFTISNGVAGATCWSIRDALAPIVKAMHENGELRNPRVSPRILRRTVETRLAAARVPQHVRGQLQSHGLGGLQTAHYDMYDYFQEKLEALQKLEELIGVQSSAILAAA